MKKKPAWPNEQFRTQEDYFTFIDEHPGHFGATAYELKKQLDKEQAIPIPKVTKTQVGSDDENIIPKVTKREDQD